MSVWHSQASVSTTGYWIPVSLSTCENSNTPLFSSAALQTAAKTSAAHFRLQKSKIHLDFSCCLWYSTNTCEKGLFVVRIFTV